MRVAVFSSKPYDETFLGQALAGLCQTRFLPVHLSLDTAELARDCPVICCFVNDDLRAPVLQRLAQLGVRFVALRCAGYNHVDLACAKNLGIQVARVPEYSPFSVAEHAVALLLSLNRHIHRAHQRVREGDYSLQGLMGFDLHGKAVGVIGGGRIGQAFCRIMSGFGCRVLLQDPALTECDWAELAPLPQLLRDAQVVSLHCPLTPQTHHLINADTLAMMQPGAVLLNTSRGALVDTRALIAALKSGHIGAVGLDVYEEEADLFFEDLSDQVIQDDVFARLTTFPNVLITAHQGFFTREASNAIATTTARSIAAFTAGQRLEGIWLT